MLDQKLQVLLQQNRRSLTKPRLAVFNALVDNGSLSMQQLVYACLPRADRATIYRVIELFEKLGVTRRVQLGWKYRLELSDIFREHHHHVECTACGKVADLHEDESFEQLITEVALRVGYKATEHSLEIRGLCAACQLLAGKN